MGWTKTIGWGVGGLGFVGMLGLAGITGWVASASEGAVSQVWDVHRVTFAIPTDAEAVERGRHLVAARYGCEACHGADLGGGVMVEDPLLGSFLAPNLTTGTGSRTRDYTAADWDRIVRHGVKPDGTASIMPAKDFFAMSDQELADLVAYVRSLPPVDREVGPVSFGPLGRALLATGQLELSATVHPDHHAAHPAAAPTEAPDAAFGEHLAQTCTGCHGRALTGGPIAGGDPTWPPAADLTALDGWTYDDFTTAMLEGRRPDGTALRSPMAEMPRMARNMSETELRAMWAYLEALSSGEARRAPRAGHDRRG